MAGSGDTLLDRLGRFLATRLESPSPGFRPYAYADPAAVRRTLRPGDVVLVEGVTRISIAIKYLTQSTWSHAALCVGDVFGDGGDDPRCLVEANLGEGVVAVGLGKYAHLHVRICRPVGLTEADRRRVVEFMLASLGKRYDLRNVIDLARYLVPTPPVPVRLRRRMLALGAGDPTRAICSSLIAEAFQRVRYPILPCVNRDARRDAASRFQRREILSIRHHSLFAPRDFDISPYFEVVKPALAGFDYRSLRWSADGRNSRPRAQGC